MRIGIKYCGGCNPLYNRGQQVEFLKEHFKEHEYCTVRDGNVCDIWLVVCGCLRACASTEGLDAKKRQFLLPTEQSFREIWDYLGQE